jgi:hypothetical protein
MQPVRISLYVAKNVFQVHGVDAEGNIVLRRRLGRAEVIRFFAELPAWLELKHAAHRIIGRVSSPSLGMMCA